MTTLSTNWEEYIEEEYFDANTRVACYYALQDMLDCHVNVLKAEILRASQNGNSHIYDTTRGYVAGLYEAIALIKQSKPNGK